MSRHDRERWIYLGTQRHDFGGSGSTFYIWQCTRGQHKGIRWAWQVDHYREATTSKKVRS